MRLPSIGFVVTGALNAARRFPLVLCAALVAAWAAITLVNKTGEETAVTRVLAAATLGFPFLFALTVLAERVARTVVVRWAIPIAGVVVLTAFWAAWPGWSSPVQVLRYAQLSVAFHLMVAFFPYAGYREPNGFWQYNKGLFLRFDIAALYSAVLFAGLAIALLALDKLFGVRVPGEGYARLWILIAFVFNTWFFVGGVPRDFSLLEARDDYPTGLRIFTQYVLVPIVALYLLILTIYLGKVLITRQWPNGWIGYLVSSVAAVGILSWLLVHPLEERAEHAWVKTFTRGFYIAIMPAIVMLWLAIWKRVEQYGITERRYFLIVLSIWLAGIAVYYTVARSRSIKVIPATLCALALVTFSGPWGAYAVSRISQRNRLAALLERHDLLAGGVLRPATGEVPLADRREISGGFRYLLETHGASALAPWLSDSLKQTLGLSRSTSNRRGSEFGARVIMTSLNLDYVSTWEGGPGEYFNYSARPVTEAQSIEGYGYALRLSSGNARDSLKVTGGTFLRLARDSSGLQVTRDGEVLLDVPLQPLVDSAAAFARRNPNRQMPAEALCVERHAAGAGALVCLKQLGGMRRQGVVKLTWFEGEAFLRLP
jgi:hypothetical protein